MSIIEKIKRNYSAITIKKDLAIKFASVPRFVSEYLIMGKINENDTLSEGDLLKIEDFLKKYRPDPKEYEVWKNLYLESNENKLIDNYSVQVDLSSDPPLRKCVVPSLKKETPIQIRDEIIDKYENLLRGGMWGLGTIKQSPKKLRAFKTQLILDDFIPFELTHFSVKQLLNRREKFSLIEWIDLLINSIGLNPDFYNNLDQKLLLLCRLIPIVEKNTNLIELGPKQTGKSYLMENISPYVYNVQSSDVTMASLFYNSNTKQVGFLGIKNVLVFDEIGDVALRSDSKDIPAKLRGFLSDGVYRRGDKEVHSNCSIVLMGNIECDENFLPKSPYYIKALKEVWQDSAMLDRFNGLIYGWELKKLTSEALSKGYGFAADFFHQTLSYLRNQNFRIKLENRVDLKNFDKTPSIRDYKAIFSITSGILKLLHPDENYTLDNLKLAIEFAIKLRTQLYNQLKYIDDEFSKEINLNYTIN